MTFKPMPILSVFTLVSLIILIVLGNWQYGRYSEKLNSEPEQQAQFSDVTVEIDTSNPGMAQQVYGIVDGEAVWRRYVPGRIDGQGDIVLVLWDATSGTVPVQLPISDTGPYSRRANVFTRPPHKTSMSSASSPEENQWYGFDSAKLLARLGYEQSSAQVVEPDLITLRLAEDASRSRRTDNPYAFERPRDPLPPERHFGYALTWWGLGAGLLVVYLAFHHSQGRLKFKD